MAREGRIVGMSLRWRSNSKGFKIKSLENEFLVVIMAWPAAGPVGRRVVVEEVGVAMTLAGAVERYLIASSMASLMSG